MSDLNKKLVEWAGIRWRYDAITKIGYYYGEIYVGKLPDFPNDLNACFKWLINPREDILRVEFSYRTRYPELEVGCKITMRSWHPDRIKGRVAFNGVAPKDNPALALYKAIEQLIDAECYK